MPKATYIQKGDVIDLVNNTGADIAYKDVIPMGSRIGVAAENIANGAAGSVNVSGVFELPAVNDTAFVVGDEVFWDTTAGALTKTPGTYKAGWVVEPKEATGTIARVKID